MTFDLGTVIAQRRLRIAGQPELDVRIRIGMPQPFPDAPHGDYYCPYQITGVGDEAVHHVGGVDALQALEETLHLLPRVLDALRKQHPGLGWEDAPDGDYGFLRLTSSRERLADRDELQKS